MTCAGVVSSWAASTCAAEAILSRAVLGAPVALHFTRSTHGLVPRLPLPADPARPRARVTLPLHASEPFEVQDVTSGIGVQVALADATDAPAETVGGYVVYRGAHTSGAAQIHRPVAAGTEDFLVFDRAPSAAAVVYEVVLGAAVAGLRLVSGTLELLGKDGRAARFSCRANNLGSTAANLFNPDTLSWTATANTVYPRYTHDAAVLHDGRVLLAGGYVVEPSEELVYSELFGIGVKLNELRLDRSGASGGEYVELTGPADTKLDGLHVLVVERRPRLRAQSSGPPST